MVFFPPQRPWVTTTTCTAFGAGTGTRVPVQDQVDEYEVIRPRRLRLSDLCAQGGHKALYGSLISRRTWPEPMTTATLCQPRPVSTATIYHGSMFKGKWIGNHGADAINAANSASTGYFTRTAAFRGGRQCWSATSPAIRYGPSSEAPGPTHRPAQLLGRLVHIQRQEAGEHCFPAFFTEMRDGSETDTYR